MLSPTVLQAVTTYYATREGTEAPLETPRIHVDEIASRLFRSYEQIRNVIDYGEEHLFRKQFIERVLRRRLVMRLEENMGESIIKDIIRAGHLPNDAVPETKAKEAHRLIKRYQNLIQHLPPLDVRERQRLTAWLTTMTAQAIEEYLFPPHRDRLLGEIAYRTLREHLVVRGPKPKPEELDMQLVIAIERALLNVDADQLRYRLLCFVVPRWNTLAGSEYRLVAEKLPSLKRGIERLMTHPLAPHLFRLVNRYASVFALTGDIIEQMKGYQSPEAMLGDETHLREEIRWAYDRRYKQAKQRLRRMAFLSVLSFLFSKIAVALAIEIPVETYLTHTFHLGNIVLNILVPPFLMLLIVAAIKLPGPHNFRAVAEEVKNVLVAGREKKYLLLIPRKQGFIHGLVARAFYAASIVAVLTLVVRALEKIHFSGANIAVFIFFVSLVAATGVKIHNRSRELSLKGGRVTVFSFLLDLVAMPFVTIGKWLLAGLARFNPLTILITVFIEMPFQVFIEFLENFRSLVTSKKEEIT